MKEFPERDSVKAWPHLNDLSVPARDEEEPLPDEGGKSRSGLARSLKTWILPFSRLHRIPVFRRVWLFLALMCGYTVFVDWIAEEGALTEVFKEATNVAYISAIFGLLLVFRTNSAYERWWEGRRLWGQLVNDSRNLCLKIKSYVHTDSFDKARLGELVVSFAYALKHHLRDTRPRNDLPGIEPIAVIPRDTHLPSYVVSRVMDRLETWLADGRITEFKMLLLDPHVRGFMDICGACERIKTTPLAVSYRAFMRQGIALNLIVIPWYTIPQLGLLWSIPVVLIGSYFLIGLELIAEDIEEPFGEAGDDLPLDRICSVIQKSVAEILPLDRSKKYTVSVDVPDFDPLKSSGAYKAPSSDSQK